MFRRLFAEWGRGHNVRGQEPKKIRGQEPNFRGQTLSRSRLGMVEAKNHGQNFSKFWWANVP